MLFLILSCVASAQTDTSRTKDSIPNTRFLVKPSDTDSTITSANYPHLVRYNPTQPAGKLLLFMPGTGGVPEKGPSALFATAISCGYRVISLAYIDTPSVITACGTTALEKDVDCGEHFRLRRAFGEQVAATINDQPQDAILNRFTKLLLYLTVFDKKGGWEKYLENGLLKWEEIAVSGFSQGGGMAAFIAKKYRVARIITFSGGYDKSAPGKIAGWYTKKSVTPPDLWYGVYHIKEPSADLIALSYKAMQIPEEHTYELKLEIPPGKKAHPEGITNIAYKPIWLEILGSGK